tara:strand:+ start:3181 stop:3741 length:561 start_codon:yes stop_codon:yes gene_type:complete
MSWWVPIATMIGSAALSSNQQASRPVRAGNQHLLGNRPVISLSPNNPQGYSLMTMPPIGYEAASPGNNIPPATLDGVGVGGGSASLSMANPETTARIGNKATSEEQDNNEVFGTGAMDEAMEKKRKADIELQKMADKNALIRQGISSAGTLLGTLMRPPPAITTGGGIRKNPPLQMFRRRRGLMSG